MSANPPGETELLPAADRPWYAGISTYQWIVLIVASAGWIFDIYENQIFVVTRGPMLSDLLHQAANSPAVKYYSDSINSAFLIGGAIGGVMFGIIADRFGRARSMILSILVYAIFSTTTAFAHSVWQVTVLRFMVAVGTGGEWAVAAALVSEVFPARARAHASGIFHASSVLGVMAAGGAAALTVGHWRYTYLLGLGPALLVLVVRWLIRDQPMLADRGDVSESSANISAIQTGPAQPQELLADGATLSPTPGQSASPPRAVPQPRSPSHELPYQSNTTLTDLWHNRAYRCNAILGLLLAAVGLAGYWGVAVAGQDLARAMLIRHGVEAKAAALKANFAYTVIQNIGGGIGLFAMGPLCAWLGRKRAFVWMQIGAVIATPITCFLPSTYAQLLILLPIMAFFVQGMHAGYAVFFPELFPTRLRATGAGLCFNGGRLIAAPMLMLSGWLKAQPHMDLRLAVSLLSLVYVIGAILVLFMPETKGKTLEA